MWLIELALRHSPRLHTSLAAKADVDAVTSALAVKASRAEVLETVDGRIDEARTQLESAIGQRATLTQLQATQDDLERRLTMLQAEDTFGRRRRSAVANTVDRLP